MTTPTLDKIIGGFNFLLARLGQDVQIRNPAKTLKDSDAEWYTTFEYYVAFTVRALPLSGGRYDYAYRVNMPTRRVGIGSYEWAFMRGDQDAEMNSKLSYNGKFYTIREVRGEVWDGDSPLIQHVVVDL